VRQRSTVFAALTTTIVLGLAGCGQPSPVPSPPREQQLPVTTLVPQADPAARWAGGYCDAVTHLVRALAALPAVDPSTPQQASRTSGDLLSSVVGGLDRSLAGLNALGAPPVPSADGGRKDVIGQFTDIRAEAENARRRIEAARGDAAATKDALGAARATLDRIDALDYLKGLQDVPALAAAEQRAPACRRLDQPAG
jgi:predicted small lipoprotein YifL